jgi:hypothetical protein
MNYGRKAALVIDRSFIIPTGVKMDIKEYLFRAKPMFKFAVTEDGGIPFECRNMSEVHLSIDEILMESEGEPVNIRIEHI